jgi:hypothetical protein
MKPLLVRTPWAVLAAGSICTAALVYACAVSPAGDCSANGTCPGDDGADAAGEGGSPDGDDGATPSEGSANLGDDAADVADAGQDTTHPSDAAVERAIEGAADVFAESAEGAIPQRPDDAARDGIADAGSAESSACDPTRTPSQDACVIDESRGVFVSPTGDDLDIGTRAHPLKTIGQAMDAAAGTAQRVYVCAGHYSEALDVRPGLDGTSVYGGLDCATWTYAASNRVVVAPAQAGYALVAEGLQAGVTFEDVEFDAQDADPINAGESSVAVFIGGSARVAFHRVVMVSGKASAGAQGASGGSAGNPSNHFTPSPGGGVQSLNGNDATIAGGAYSTSCACPSGTASSMGGQGGDGSKTPGAGLPSYGGGAGAPGTNMDACNGLVDGAVAPAAAADVPTGSLGVFSALGWAPAMGKAGATGAPGQGGGGGGDGELGVGAGGGGACGGCGGEGGKAGTGGGSSIALLSFQSSVALVGCTLVAHDAGNGGSGGDGEAGESGGMGGIPSVSGCPGGAGGNGAGGNGAQGGPGGVSIGIGYSSTAPMLDGIYVVEAAGVTGITTGKAGTGGLGGAGGPAVTPMFGSPGADGANGKSGAAQAVLGL